MPVWDTLNDLKDALHGDIVRNNPTDPELQDLGHPQVSGEGVKEHGLQSKVRCWCIITRYMSLIMPIF